MKFQLLFAFFSLACIKGFAAGSEIFKGDGLARHQLRDKLSQAESLYSAKEDELLVVLTAKRAVETARDVAIAAGRIDPDILTVIAGTGPLGVPITGEVWSDVRAMAGTLIATHRGLGDVLTPPLPPTIGDRLTALIAEQDSLAASTVLAQTALAEALVVQNAALQERDVAVQARAAAETALVEASRVRDEAVRDKGAADTARLAAEENVAALTMQRDNALAAETVAKEALASAQGELTKARTALGKAMEDKTTVEDALKLAQDQRAAALAAQAAAEVARVAAERSTASAKIEKDRALGIIATITGIQKGAMHPDPPSPRRGTRTLVSQRDAATRDKDAAEAARVTAISAQRLAETERASAIRARDTALAAQAAAESALTSERSERARAERSLATTIRDQAAEIERLKKSLEDASKDKGKGGGK